MPSQFPLAMSDLPGRKVSAVGADATSRVRQKPGDRDRPAKVTSRAMNDEDGYFGEDVAATYDDGFEGHFDPAVIGVTADALAGLAGGAAQSGHGRALEFAVGTGRVALPLAARGV